MKCGFLGTKGLQDELKDHNGVVQDARSVLRRGENGTITIPASATFRFEGYKTAIIRFLLDYSLRMFESTSSHLNIKSGKEMEVDVVKVLLETVPKAIAGAIHAPSELYEAGFAAKDGLEAAFDHLRGGVNRAADQREGVKPGKLYTWADHRLNKRLIIDLQSYAPLNDSSWKQLDKTITFANLAGFIRDEL
jgi:hypothetical protein